MNEDMFVFGNLLVQYRKRLGVRTKSIARFLGQTSETITEWEECVSFPSIRHLPRIASAYEGDLEELRKALETSIHHVRETHKRCLEAQRPTKAKAIPRDAWGFIPSTNSGQRIRSRAPI